MEFERKYIELIQEVLANGQYRVGRNGATYSLFGKTLEIDCLSTGNFPLLLGRKMYYQGVLGELAAFVRRPSSVTDFTDQGCNYWADWAKADGSLVVDYGNKWLDFGGVNQLDLVRATLKTNPADRRMIISAWDPSNLQNLSLPCCHLLYQWYVREGKLDMLWFQRSADTMIGMPSDIILAAAFNIMLANNVNLIPGKVTMVFGDTHIYEEHAEKAAAYIEQFKRRSSSSLNYPSYLVDEPESFPLEEFVSTSLVISGYSPAPPIKFELKA